jgi:hypothetical protein
MEAERIVRMTRLGIRLSEVAAYVRSCEPNGTTKRDDAGSAATVIRARLCVIAEALKQTQYDVAAAGSAAGPSAARSDAPLD